MTWFKVDDGLAFHPKVVAAGNAAMGLWVRAGSWCAANLTDGYVPRHVVKVLGTVLQAKALERVDLWTATDGGWQFKGWTDYQPTRTTVEADREWNRRRQELFRDPALVEAIRTRDQDRCRYCGTLVNWKDKRGSSGATYDHLNPRGPSTLDNLVVACRGCNSRKSNRNLQVSGMILLPLGALGTQVVSESYPVTNWLETSDDLVPVPSRPVPSVVEVVGPPQVVTPRALTMIESRLGTTTAKAQAIADAVIRDRNPRNLPNYLASMSETDLRKYLPAAGNQPPKPSELCEHGQHRDHCPWCKSEREAVPAKLGTDLDW